jgi:hypothetical protein
MKYWEIIADNLSKAGWSWGCVATVDSIGRTIFVANAHRGWSRKNKARQIAMMMVKASSITSSDSFNASLAGIKKSPAGLDRH